MSSEMEEALEIAKTCEIHARRLKEMTLAGSPSAVVVLADIAVEMIKAIHSVWHENPADALLERREMLSAVLKDRMSFPILHYINQPADSKLLVEQDAVLNGIAYGALKARRRKENAVKYIVEKTLKEFEQIRFWKKPAPGITDDIFNLPPLSAHSLTAWVDHGVEWILSRRLSSRANLRTVMNPERDALRGVRKKKKRAEAYKKSREKEGGGKMDFLEATKYQVKMEKALKELVGVNPTAANAKAGLREHFRGYLLRNLASI